MGFIPRGLPRIRHTGESRYPENQTGFRVKHGMTVKDRSDTPQLAAGSFIWILFRASCFGFRIYGLSFALTRAAIHGMHN